MSRKTIQDVKIGDKFNHPEKGEGLIIGKTQRTITMHYEKSTCKVTYKSKDAYFYASDF